MDQEEDNDSISSDEMLTPTKITDRDWVGSGLDITLTDKEQVGKWMVFLDSVSKDEEELTPLDRAWATVLDMKSKGIIIGAGCSTGSGNETPISSDSEASASCQSKKKKSGVINIYTRDFKDMEDVERVAREIHKTLDYRKAIFYKTNIDTKCQKFRSTGFKNISLYLHTPKCGLLIKDKSGNWVKPEKGEDQQLGTEDASLANRDSRDETDEECILDETAF